MRCPQCSIDMSVESAGVELANDDTPDKATEVYAVQVFRCRNPNCSSFGKIGEKIKTKLN